MEKSIESVKTQSAQLLKAKEQISPYGHRAVVLDLEGNAIALYSKLAR